jgi:rare lipoprotein A
MAAIAALLAAGCASTGPGTGPGTGSSAVTGSAPVAQPPAATAPAPARPSPRRGGAFYLDDGPGDNPPPDLASIPDAQPRSEPLHRFANRPYVVFGRSYTPMTARAPYRARGVATWYGTRYHSKKTSSGEVYDMYQMTGAHPTLPIPSYVRVTNVANGRQVIVRINDRGPFIGERLIDLSYAAAFRLGYVEAGSALVEVEKLIPGVNWSSPSIATTQAPVSARPPDRSASAAGAATIADPALPAAPADLPARPGSLPLASAGGGVFLQLGAFADRSNAETFLERIRPELGEAANLAHVHLSRGLHRVHVGPYTGEREARSATDALARRLNIKPLVTVR